MTKEEDFAEIADGVFVRHHRFLQLNCGLVVGEGGCLVIDTSASAAHGRHLADAVRRVTAAPWQVVNTHVHWDHCFGNEAFSPAPIWAHAATIADLEANGALQQREVAADVEGDDPQLAADLRAVVVTVPDRSVEQDAVVDVGGRTVRLLHRGLAHTDGDLAVAVPDAGVLFAGDLVEVGADPSFHGAYPSDWPAALRAILRDADCDVVVPGHGAVTTRSSALAQADAIDALARALELAHEEGGRTAAELVAAGRGMGFGDDAVRVAAERIVRRNQG